MSPERGNEAQKVDMRRMRRVVEQYERHKGRMGDGHGVTFYEDKAIMYFDGPAILELIDTAVELRVEWLNRRYKFTEHEERLLAATEPFLPEEES